MNGHIARGEERQQERGDKNAATQKGNDVWESEELRQWRRLKPVPLKGDEKN